MSQLEKMNHQHQHARSPKEAHGDFFSHYFCSLQTGFCVTLVFNSRVPLFHFFFSDQSITCRVSRFPLFFTRSLYFRVREVILADQERYIDRP